MEEAKKYSSQWWREQNGILTPWEGGPAWRVGERWEHQVKADGAKDKYFHFYGPVKPGVAARTVRMSAPLPLMPVARCRHSA